MNAFNALMQQHGYLLADDGSLTLKSAQSRHSATFIAPLNDFEVLEVTGQDGERFLQGQTSQQLSLVDGQLAPLTAFCTPKGRILAMAQLMRLAEDRLWLLMPAGTAEPLRAHLAKFAPFYKVTLGLVEDIAVLGLSGEEAVKQAAVTLSSNALPEHDFAALATAEKVLVRQPSHGVPRAILLGNADSVAQSTATLLSNDIALSDPQRWALEDIRAGLHWVMPTQTDAWLPQMLNLEALAAISFKKGCYTGQEVVARAHFRGQVKKRLQRFVTRAEEQSPLALPTPGSKLLDANGKAGGEVMRAAPDEEGNLELLAVVSIRDESAEWHLDTSETPVALMRAELPYALERRDPEQLKG